MRFRALAEVKPEANILNSGQYPEILDDSLNFISPYHTNEEKEDLISNMESVLGTAKMRELAIIQIKHPLNGPFLVFQSGL